MDASRPLGHKNIETARVYIEGSKRAGKAAAARVQLLELADIAFDALSLVSDDVQWERDFSDDRASLKAALELFDKLLQDKGIPWIIDSAGDSGLTHLGLVMWLESARKLAY